MARAQLSGAARRAAFAVAGATAATLLSSFVVHQPAWPPFLLALAIAVLAALRPFDALLVVAGLGPLTTAFLLVVHDIAGGTRYPEVLVLAFLAGVMVHLAAARHPPRLPAALAWTALPLVVAALASAVVQAAALRAEQPALTLGGTFPIVLLRDYLLLPNGVARGVQFAEGLLLLLTAAAICGGDADRRDRLTRMLIASAAAAAAINVLRLITAALAQPPFWPAVGAILVNVRFNVQYADRNAAGSYFALMLLVTAAYASRRPLRYALPAVMIGLALWLTGSRTAFTAVALGGAGLAFVDWKRRGGDRAVAAVALGTLIVLAAAGAKWYPQQRNDPAAFSLSTRAELTRAGLRMAADYPVFGVGLGRYFDLSGDYAGDLLRFLERDHENAHDYFVQVLAELGVPGFALFVAVLALALRSSWPPRGAPLREWGLPIGLLAYLATCLSGHPFITPEAAYPFWLALGTAAAAGAAVPAGRRLRAASVIAVVVLAASVPLRAIDAVHHARLDNTSIGLSLFQRGPDNVRYRWSLAHSTFYVDASATTMIIPFRLGPDATGPLTARILVNDKEANRVIVSSRDEWQTVRFVAAQGVRGDFVRVDIAVDPASAVPAGPPGQIPRALAVGRPTVLWDADTPTVDVPFAADVDGDGRADLIVWSAETGRWHWLLSSSNYDELRPGAAEPAHRHAGGTPLVGDIDGDGRADLVVWRSATATWEWLESSSGYRQSSARSVAWGDRQPGDVPLLADVDGDGRDDLILWRAGTRTWMWRTAATGFASGGALTVPAVPREDHAVPVAGRAGRGGRSAAGLWSVLTGGGVRLQWLTAGGTAGSPLEWADRAALDIPFLADVDRDGRPDVVAWRPATGTWTWRLSSADFAPTPPHELQWGSGSLGDVPITADFDGDGAADFAVWRSSTRTWYWITSGSRYAAAAGRLKPWKF